MHSRLAVSIISNRTVGDTVGQLTGNTQTALRTAIADVGNDGIGPPGI